MTYHTAKIELTQEGPRVSFLGILAEAVCLTAIAGLLVLLVV